MIIEQSQKAAYRAADQMPGLCNTSCPVGLIIAFDSGLEQAIIDYLQKFLMELGKGYAFVGRQQHIHK